MAQKWHQENPVAKVRISEGVRSQVPEEYAFCQEAQEKLQEIAGKQWS